MKRRISFCLALISITLLFANETLLSEKHLTIADLFGGVGVSEPALSPDGKWVAYTLSTVDFENNDYNTEICRVSARGEDAVRLTDNPKHDGSPQWSPDGSRIAFISDRSGKNQVWLMNPFGGEPVQLTASETDISSFAWSFDGKKIAFIAPEPKSKEEKDKDTESAGAIIVDEDFEYARLWTIDTASKEVLRLTGGRLHVRNFDWSPDGRMLVFSASPTPKVPDQFHSDLYTIPAAGGDPRPLVTARGPDHEPKWSPDGKHIAFISQQGSIEWWANTYLCLIPAAGGEIMNLTKSFDEQINDYFWSGNSLTIYFQAAQRTESHLFSVSIAPENRGITQISHEPAYHASFAPSGDGNRVVFIKETPEHPADIFSTDLSNFSPVQITSHNPWLDDFPLGKTEVLSFKGTDGLTIEGILIKPVGFEEGKRYPLLVIPHGGPMGVWTKRFYGKNGAYPIQVFADQGYLIFLPNFRGSGGYGEKFRGANIRDWGGMDYLDVQAGVDELIRMGMADEERMGIMGWSYGGFMTSWSITQTNRFKAASVGAGVTNLFSFFGVTDIPEFMESYFEQTPWEDTGIYTSRSALFHLNKVTTPTLIQHGTDDRRVPLSQGEELYIGLRKNNVEATFVKYPREPHGFREPKHQRDANEWNLKWFNDRLEEKSGKN